MQDRFIKIMLVVVAALLAANLVQTRTPATSSIPLFIGNASAQTQGQQESTPVARNYQVRSVKGFSVEDLQSIVPLGDGHSFIASNPKGFMVYQVVPAR